MHGAVPILRTTAAIVCQTPSRIPHLNFHILRRKTKNLNLRPLHASSVAQQQRQQSTAVHVEDFRPFNAALNHQVSGAEQSRLDTQDSLDAGSKSVAHATYAASEKAEDVNFYSILEKNSQDLVLLALSNETIGAPFIRDAPDNLFNKALLMLDPDRFIEPYIKMYRHLKNNEDEEIPYRGLRQIEERLHNYANLLQRMIDLRHEGKNKLTLASCRHILRWASSLGHEMLAIHVFDEVMKADGIEPDVDCYNHYMAALNWSHAYSQAEKFSLRVLPVRMKIRGLQYRPAALSGHRTENLVTGRVGIRGEILQSFRQLVEHGHTANEATFINMMTAMGREGDIKGVVSILKSVWNIDLGLLEMYDEDEIESPTFYEDGHHLRPTTDLLVALAHIFGSNNDARTAWTLVDYVSRNYDIPITRQVWTELLEWYMVLSISRGGAASRKGFATGSIPFDVFEQLLSSMKDQPHNIVPDSAAYYLQSRVRQDKRHLEQQVETIRNLRARFEESTKQMHQSMKHLTAHMTKMTNEPLQHLWDRPHFHQLRHDFLMDSLEFEASLSMLRHALVQRLLRYRYWPGGRKETEWERRRLPNLIAEFAPYLPTALEYRIISGSVSLKDPSYSQHTARVPYSGAYKSMVKLRMLLDTEDHDTLLQGTQHLIRSL